MRRRKEPIRIEAVRCDILPSKNSHWPDLVLTARDGTSIGIGMSKELCQRIAAQMNRENDKLKIWMGFDV